MFLLCFKNLLIRTSFIHLFLFGEIMNFFILFKALKLSFVANLLYLLQLIHMIKILEIKLISLREFQWLILSWAELHFNIFHKIILGTLVLFWFFKISTLSYLILLIWIILEDIPLILWSNMIKVNLRCLLSDTTSFIFFFSQVEIQLRSTKAHMGLSQPPSSRFLFLMLNRWRNINKFTQTHFISGLNKLKGIFNLTLFNLLYKPVILYVGESLLNILVQKRFKN